MSIALKDDAGRTAYKLHLAYVLCEMVCAVDKNPLPGWTGFNTMLCQHIPNVQSVGYRPVINRLPTEYSQRNPHTKQGHCGKATVKVRYLKQDPACSMERAQTCSLYDLVNFAASFLSSLPYQRFSKKENLR